MNAKKMHTPGEWIAEHIGSGGTYDNPTDVYQVHNGYTVIADSMTENDARLLAAAPALLTALEGMLPENQDAAFQDDGSTSLAAINRARAAISRARG